MIHQFNETGIYCFKTSNNQIGTIIVEQHKAIFHIPLSGEQLSKLEIFKNQNQKKDFF